MYSINGEDNFAILDSPGDTEIDKYLQFFSKKGYIYSKMLIYIMDERIALDSDSIGNNENLKELLNLTKDYKIPLIILLTHSDNYCEEIKKTERDWKEICLKTINDNKSNLLKFINDTMNNYNIGENDIMHIVLVEEKVETLEEKLKNLDEETREEYDKSDEATRKMILKIFYRGKNSNNNEVKDFLDKEIKILRQKELIKKIKEKLPSQYHSALIQK